MKFIFLIFFVIISKFNTKLPENEKYLILQNLSGKQFQKDDNQKDIIKYDIKKIKEIIDKYDFPRNYSFIEDTKAEIYKKIQGNCNCSWSISSSTALSYRFHKKGIELDLSPQYSLSCYIKNCSYENYLIDSQLNLIKNGTVSEECLPFSSKDGKSIEECPQSCKNGSELIKYYSHNPYTTENYYSEINYYDIVKLIMDELITNGPVVCQIDLYPDFIEWNKNYNKCVDDIYEYNSDDNTYIGKYFATIIGYGFSNNKYYWLIQNSIGEENCIFNKIEFGQIGIERVAFSEPYIKNESDIPKNVNISFVNITDSCELIISNISSIDEWYDSLEIKYQNDNKNDFYYFCSKNDILNESDINCYYEKTQYFLEKGFYNFNSWKSLGKKNLFNLDLSFQEKEFYFFGYDKLDILVSKDIYISKNGSAILLNYIPNEKDEENIPKIYSSIYSNKELRNCKKIQSKKDLIFNYIYCNLTEDEIEYFGDPSKDNYISYSVLCGKKIQTKLNVHKLDLNKYPRFTIKKIVMPNVYGKYLENEYYFTRYDKFQIYTRIEGEKSYIKSIIINFYILAIFNKNNKSEINMLSCYSNNDEYFYLDEYQFQCNTFMYDSYGDDIEFLPYIFYNNINLPHEIIMEDSIKAEKYSGSKYLDLCLILIISTLVILN
jgi:hypothetical protein